MVLTAPILQSVYEWMQNVNVATRAKDGRDAGQLGQEAIGGNSRFLTLSLVLTPSSHWHSVE